MNNYKRYKFIELLIFQKTTNNIELVEWQYIIQVLRESNLLASCFHRLKAVNKLTELPDYAVKHLSAASVYGERQSQQIKMESEIINTALNNVGIEPVYLKGAGYTLRSSRNSHGRVCSDIDVLVNKEQISDAELALAKAGWATKDVTRYDDKYYREWSHEIPPMISLHRGTVIDLHHNIVLPISGRKPNLTKFKDNALSTKNGSKVLSVPATIIHSIVHLILNEDVSNGFRDLLDILTLIEDNESTKFWQDLIKLTNELKFANEVYICFCLLEKVAKFKVEAHLFEQLSTTTNKKYLTFVANNIYYYAIQPQSKYIQTKRHLVAVFSVFIMGHLKKMPLKVLIPHAVSKITFAISDQIFGKHHFDK